MLAPVVDVCGNQGEFLTPRSSPRTESFAANHDDHVWRCMRSILGVEGAPENAQVVSQLPFALGGLSLMSAVRSRVAAHWSSWADCVHMIKQRHPQVAETLIMGILRHVLSQ